MFDFGLKEKNRKERLAPTFSLKKGGGFTLVEVIIVLVIISLLMAIIIINTGTARKKGKDAAIQSSLREVRNAAELYYDNNKSYSGVCDPADDTLVNTGDFGRIEQYIIQQNGAVTCREIDRAYAVISSLNMGDCWCVDSEGASRKIELSAGETCADKLTSAVCP